MLDDQKINFLNIPVDCLTMERTIQKIEHAIATGRQINHVVINASKVVAMQTNADLYRSIVECDIINADGQSIVWAASFLGTPLPERVAGIDLMQHLVEKSFEKKYKIFFFGAKEEIVSKVVSEYSKRFSPEIIAGYRNGYYKSSEEAEIAKTIVESGANLLFVAINSPKKEIFMHNYREQLKNVNFIMGVGGSFDVIAGYTKRAPLWMQKGGLEWFYRLIQEPRRMWKRYLIGNFKFLILVLKEKFSK